MEKAIFETRKLIDEKRFLGELDQQCHDSSVNLSNVSHLVTDLRMEGNNLLADIQILTTPRGRALQELLDRNEVVFAPRGLGEIGEDRIIKNYKLITIDAVPSRSPELNNLS